VTTLPTECQSLSRHITISGRKRKQEATWAFFNCSSTAKARYAQKGGSFLHDLGTVKVARPGKAFQFMVMEGGPGVTDYYLAFDYLELVLASRLEAEKLSADSTTRLKRVVDPI
jgi:hypothetical protein